MQLIPLKSQKISQNDDLLPVFLCAVESASEPIKEKDVVVIASKALAYSQGRLVEIQDIHRGHARGRASRQAGHRTSTAATPEVGQADRQDTEFQDLVNKEADVVLDEGDMVITLKNKILIPNAGIDNSNTPEDQVILWPNDPFGSARDIRDELKNKFGLKDIGVLISDSHCQPLRSGTTGIAIGWAGFYGVKDERGSKDLFGKEMTYTQIAVADDLASAANVLMGETDASIPFVIVRDAPVKFTDKPFSEEDYFISPDECIYKGLYNDKL